MLIKREREIELINKTGLGGLNPRTFHDFTLTYSFACFTCATHSCNHQLLLMQMIKSPCDHPHELQLKVPPPPPPPPPPIAHAKTPKNPVITHTNHSKKSPPSPSHPSSLLRSPLRYILPPPQPPIHPSVLYLHQFWGHMLVGFSVGCYGDRQVLGKWLHMKHGPTGKRQ